MSMYSSEYTKQTVKLKKLIDRHMLNVELDATD